MLISNVFQELVSVKNGNRLKKRLCIAFVVLCLAIVGISGLAYYGIIKPSTAASSGKSNNPGDPVSITDVLEGKFYARHNNATWISDTELFYRDSSVRRLRFAFF